MTENCVPILPEGREIVERPRNAPDVRHARLVLTPTSPEAIIEQRILNAAADLIEELVKQRDEAILRMGDWARKAGEAEGALEISEMAGVVKGWQSRALAAEQREARLRDCLRAIAEGNLGDASWQADYARIRDTARAALSTGDEG